LRPNQQLLIDRQAPWKVPAITSSRHPRVHHDELARRVLDLVAEHPDWQGAGRTGRGVKEEKGASMLEELPQ